MKIKIGKVIIDSNDDPKEHKRLLGSTYNVICALNYRMNVTVGIQQVVLTYTEDRVLIGVTASYEWPKAKCWVDGDGMPVIPEEEIVHSYQRKTDVLGILKRD